MTDKEIVEVLTLHGLVTPDGVMVSGPVATAVRAARQLMDRAAGEAVSLVTFREDMGR